MQFRVEIISIWVDLVLCLSMSLFVRWCCTPSRMLSPVKISLTRLEPISCQPSVLPNKIPSQRIWVPNFPLWWLCLPFMFISQDSSAFVCNSHHRHGFSVVFGSFFCFGRRRLEVFSDPDGGITFASWMCASGVSFQSHYIL